MSFTKEQYMLRYQKAKVKLMEYSVPLSDYPSFQLNYKELAFPTVYCISEYSCAVIEGDLQRQKDFNDQLTMCAEFYDAALKSREQKNRDIDFLLSGAIAYFYKQEYGSVLVMLREIQTLEIDIPYDSRGLLVNMLYVIFYGHGINMFDHEVLIELNQYLRSGDKKNLISTLEAQYSNCVLSCSDLDAFFMEAVYAIALILINNSAREYLPISSDLSYEKWKPYLESSKSIKMLWPSQKLICEKGVLKGRNAVVQLPTGVGKTKSIELIIRSMFLSERGKIALIVAPLRALCNEITDDMIHSFPKSVSINQFSDIFEFDYLDIFLNGARRKILVCTPEKLQYIFHHDPSTISRIDLFVFDEGHMFDDPSRGAQYELLVLKIRNSMLKTQQMVIMSAVLSNAEKIATWALGESGELASDRSITSTPKVTGFVSASGQIHYFSDSLLEEDFFIPNAIRKQRLQSLRKTKEPHYFPEDNAKDYAIYIANRLCSNGGVAIYMSQKRYIPSLLKRIAEIKRKGGELGNIKAVSNRDEVIRLNELIKLCYGEESEYYKAAEVGVFPHFSSLPNGLKNSVEYAYRNNMIKVVACTSTLAQGVNIPIKYLIMTSLNSAYTRISPRSFKNLIGRTARAGVYTEGSVIISDPKLYDWRESLSGNAVWNEIRRLFINSNTSECDSAILSVVQDFVIPNTPNNVVYKGNQICSIIIEHIDNWQEYLLRAFLSGLEKLGKKDSRTEDFVRKRIKQMSIIIGSIENVLCTIICNNELLSDQKIIETSHDLCVNTLAYNLATDYERIILYNLFTSIGMRISKHIYKVKKTKSLVNLDYAIKITSFIESEQLGNVLYEYDVLLKKILELYNVMNPDLPISWDICIKWIFGKTYKEMSEELEVNIHDIEDTCSQRLSYQLSFLVGNVIDYLDNECPNIRNLMLLQKQLKYGVNTQTAISICEKLFNERVVVNRIVNLLDDKTITEDQIENYINVNKELIHDLIKEYPSYFSYRLSTI